MPDLKPTITQGDDGSLHFAFPEGVHAVYTGPIDGAVTLADGTEYHVRADWIGAASVEHAQEVAHLIALRHVAEGHPAHDATSPFTYAGKQA